MLLQNITLGAVGTVRGRVLDANRVPVEAAAVTLQMTAGQRFAYSTSTNADGSFVLPAVLTGPYLLTAGKGAEPAAGFRTRDFRDNQLSRTIA